MSTVTIFITNNYNSFREKNTYGDEDYRKIQHNLQS